MKPSDLRRFNDTLGIRPWAWAQASIAGCTFMVLEIGGTQKAPWASFLVGSHLEEKWGYEWVEKNSEPINEVG